MNCEICNQQNAERATLCTWCGTPLAAQDRPNTIPDRDLGQLINHTLHLYRKNFWSFIILGLPLQLVGLVGFFLLPEYTSGLVGEYTPEFTPDVARDNFYSAIPIFLLFGLFMGFAYLIVEGATTNAVGQQYLGRKINVLGSYRTAIARLWILIVAGLLAILGMVVGFSLLALVLLLVSLLGVSALIGVGLFFVIVITISLGIYLTISWTFIVKVIIIEGADPVSALRSSFNLVRGGRWRIVGIGFTIAMLSLGLQIPILIAAAILGNISQPLASIVSAIGQAVIGPITFIGLTVLYFDLRTRKEALTLDSLVLELGTTVAGASRRHSLRNL